MRVSPESSSSKKNKLKLLAGAAAATLGLTALVAANANKEESSPAPAKYAELTNTDAGDSSLDSINRFRRQVLVQDKARVMLNTCVAWPSMSGGLTVTLNPGLGLTEDPKGFMDFYYVFSARDKRSNSGLVEMNGPSVQSPVTSINMAPSNNGINVNEVKTIALSPDPVAGPNGQLSYQEAKTHVPVLDTVIVSGPDTAAHAKSICEDLAAQRPISD